VLQEGLLGPAYAVVQVEDVTARRSAELALRAREEAFRLAFDHAITAMMFVGVDGELTAANEALLVFLGRPEHDLVGKHIATLTAANEHASLRAGAIKLAAGTISEYQAEHRFQRADGSDLWGVVSGERVDDAEGYPSYLVFQIKDSTPGKQAEIRLARQSFRDGLTGLANRALLRDRLDQARARAARSHSRFAVLSIDLDDFKDVNDRLGHAAGDEVLVEVGARLLGCLRPTDTACRSGGDEFHIVCEDIQEPAEVALLIERIEAALHRPFKAAGTDVHLTVSAGVVAGDGTAPAEETLRDADAAMYRAKENGKNRHEVHSPQMRAALLRRGKLATELEVALADGELRLHYQPMFAIETKEIVGMEALLRWQHPSRGLLAPGHFIDVAESLHLMTPIGDWVIATAIAQAAVWYERVGPRLPVVWVNVSSQQLGMGRIVAHMQQTLAKAGVPPTKFGVEITERHLIGEADDVQGDLLALSDLGVRLAVDDFGTGYGSFDYLRRFPFNEIKIDVSFIAGLGRDRTDTALTSSIVALGRSLDLVVVAEGVETQDQYDRLIALACPVAQGYLLQRPASAEAIDLLLSSNRERGTRRPQASALSQ
jgi:diguanylate cyclase (GGDEF)-like protein/PAS domain S-box-containing protein